MLFKLHRDKNGNVLLMIQNVTGKNLEGLINENCFEWKQRLISSHNTAVECSDDKKSIQKKEVGS